MSVPIIDIAGLAEGEPGALARIASEIGHACRETGFFYVRGHGVAATDIAAVFRAAHAFFALPQAQKDALGLIASTGNRGYVGLRTEALDPASGIDDKEAMNIGLELALDDPEIAAGVPSRRPNLWPDLPGFRDVTLSYFASMLALGRNLHRAIAHDLGLAPDHFAPHFERPMATLRLLRYPPPHARETALGAGAHTDYGNLTILALDDAGGLEVQRLDGAWIEAPPVPGAFVCNIGDCLMRWTNDVYRSTPHRVRNPHGRERVSIAFFLDAAPDALVETIPSCIDASRPALYPPMTAADYLASRFAATYGF